MTKNDYAYYELAECSYPFKECVMVIFMDENEIPRFGAYQSEQSNLYRGE